MKITKTMLVSAILLSMALGATGAYALYSAQTGTVENTFNIAAGGGGSGDSVGTVDETFDPTTSRDLEPRSTFRKDVKLNSNVSYTSYAYLYVTVPNINARLGGESSKSYRDAVTLDINSSKWTLVKSTAGSAAAPSKYLYRYKTVLAADAVTDSLFTKATVPDYVESDGVTGTIDVSGFMVSSVNVAPNEADETAIANYFG